MSVSNDSNTTRQSILSKTNVTSKTKIEVQKEKFNSTVTTMTLKSVTTKIIRKTLKTSSAVATGASKNVTTNKLGKSKQDFRSITKTDKDNSVPSFSKYIYIVVGLSVIIVVSAMVLIAKRLVFSYEKITVCFKLY